MLSLGRFKILQFTHVRLFEACYSFFANLSLYYLTFVFRNETSILTTISKPANRALLQLIHVKGAAVFHSNFVFPPAAIVCPMITNFTGHFAVCHRGMLPFDPSRGMRTTTTHRWTVSGHLWVTSNSSKAIPARGNISLITSDLALSSERFEAVGSIEALVVAARVSRCNCIRIHV